MKTVPQPGPALHVVVGCAALHGSRSDWLVEKCTELGASALSPLLSERSPTFGGPNKGKAHASATADSKGRLGRWQRVAQAALKQSLRVHELHLSEPWSMQRLESETQEPGTCTLVAAEGGENALTVLPSAVAAPGNVSHAPRRVLLVVGPPGDFAAHELGALQDAGALLVGLGRARLRTETAAMALLTACALHRDLDPAQR